MINRDFTDLITITLIESESPRKSGSPKDDLVMILSFGLMRTFRLPDYKFNNSYFLY